MPADTPDRSPDPADPPRWNSRPVTLLLDPDGRLIRLIRGGAHDDDVLIAPGQPVQEIFPFPAGTADGWETYLSRLHEDPNTSVRVDVPIVGPTAETPGELRRNGTAIPITGAGGALEQIVVQLQLAYETNGQAVSKDEQFRLLAETLPHMLWISRLDGTIEYYSPQWADFTGRTIDDLLAHGIHDLVHTDDLAALMKPGSSPDGTYQPRPFRLRRSDGEYRWVEALINPVHDDDGTVWRVVGSTNDITDRLAAEQERRELTDQLAAALSVSRLGRFTTDVRTDRAQVDQRFLDILGIPGTPETRTSRLELVEAWPTIHADDAVAYKAALDASWAEGVPLAVEFRAMRPSPNGPQERWLSVLARVEMVDGVSVGMVGVIGDVTDRRAEVAARLRSQKREALGTLVGGIAHDFNNVIGAILSNAALAEAEIAAGESPATSLAEIRRGAERAGDVVRRLLGFGREGDHAEELCDLSSITQEACELLRPTLTGIKLGYDGASPPPVLGSSTELHQVVVNLLQNAGQAAADGGGTVDLSIDVVSAEELQTTTAPEDPIAQLAAGNYVRLTVTDDGAGIPPAILTRIFDPFFTTKESGHGTGLGLAAAQAIVRNHGGEIAAANRQPPSTGAVFTVVLPVADAPAPQPEPQSPKTAPPDADAAPPHVLFVDDEAPLARLAARAFPLHGCSVDVFTDPVDALAAFQASPQRYDALVTDLSMPHLSGLELAGELLALRPDLPVVLSSGYMTPDNRAAAIERGIREVIPKPCALQDVADAVLRLTSTPSSAATAPR